MSQRLSVCVVHVPPFDPHRPLGGAEVIAAHLTAALAATAEVTVLCGHPANAPSSGAATLLSDPPVRRLAAFPLDEHVRTRGHIRPRLTTTAQDALTGADAIVSIERTIDHPAPAPRIACLGGIGYPHTLDVLTHQAWDRLIVPSSFVACQVAQHVPRASGVTVITNGIDTTHFRPRDSAPPPHTGARRLLLPGRPTWDKGLLPALRLARALRDDGQPPHLVCFAQPDGLGPSTITDQMRSRAAADGITLNVLPWRPHAAMPDAYHDADLTLCLGEAAEGFGLTTAESVACATPVLASPSGFLADMLPRGHGLHLLDPGTGTDGLLGAAHDALAHGAQRCRDYGRPYISRHYSTTRMTAHFVRLVNDLARS